MRSVILGRASTRSRPAPAHGWSTGGRRRLIRGLVVASALLVCAMAWVLATADDTVVPPLPGSALSRGEHLERVPATPSRGAMGQSW